MLWNVVLHSPNGLKTKRWRCRPKCGRRMKSCDSSRRSFRYAANMSLASLIQDPRPTKKVLNWMKMVTLNLFAWPTIVGRYRMVFPGWSMTLARRIWTTLHQRIGFNVAQLYWSRRNKRHAKVSLFLKFQLNVFDTRCFLFYSFRTWNQTKER